MFMASPETFTLEVADTTAARHFYGAFAPGAEVRLRASEAPRAGRGSVRVRPARWARTAAWTRFSTPSLPRIALTWSLAPTARSPRPRSTAPSG
ncbi:hypothetical protein JYK04_04574 [Streptomyces nojiriensis]|nr:hypothetical protein JYK04_04574 [Streptomyces nojiriensis]